MEVFYKRDFSESYMIVEGEPCDTGYEEQMLRQNQIRCLLSFYTMETNGRMQFWYEITGKESLHDYLQQQKLDVTTLDQIVTYLAIAYEEIERYLLLQQHIFLQPDSIFIDKNARGFSLRLCYCPMQMGTFAQQFREVMEYILTVVDHKEEQLTRICYDMYELAMTDDYNISSVVAVMEQQMTTKENEEAQGSPYVEKIDLTLDSTEENSAFSPVSDADSPNIETGDDTDTKEFSSGNGLFQILVTGSHKIINFLRGTWETQDVQTKESFSEQFQERFPERFPERFQEKIQVRFQEQFQERLRKKIRTSFRGEEEKEEGLDFVFEPKQEEDAPTQLLHDNTLKCSGTLKYTGNQQEEDYVIDQDDFRIGSRAATNEASLRSQAVSRHHARIIREGDEYYLEDLNSTNGTFVNGNILNYKERVRLCAMDRIQFADVPYIIS